ncbi:GntR family transcriptional regulator [Gemmobacter sp.]|uniref:GntR family transcriptional regulator n=1 Tax=Gemmobacter sp. TaxID=1898957 RepID=UPI002AFFA496|nr:GntR family transcriptional regulator [Gemmobacter sp.]
MPEPKRESLTTQAYQQLRADIVACRHLPGSKLVISDLVARMGFSLGAVREALSRLTSEGLVVAETNKGFQVAPITQADLEDLTRTRSLIEIECLRDAIAHGDVKWEAGIIASLFELSRTPQYLDGAINEGWADAHARFHRALVAACTSPAMLRIREALYSQSERYRRASQPADQEAARDVATEHQAIADATIARDTEAAAEAMRQHLRLTTRILIEAGVADARA